MTDTLLLYVVRNQEGHWFRNRGLYGSHKDHWVPELKEAKLYSKIGPARARVTYFTNAFPKYGVPDIVELTVTSSRVLDEKVRVTKVVESLRTKEARAKQAEAKRELERAEKKLKDAQDEIARLRRTR